MMTAKERENVSAVSFESKDDAARAEVTMFAQGSSFHALKPLASLSDADRKTLSYEAVDPVAYAPSRGLDRPFAVAVRPGETARLDVELVGPVRRPGLEFRSGGGEWFSVGLGADLAEGESRVVRRAGRPLSGVWTVQVTSDTPETANARVDVVKRYAR